VDTGHQEARYDSFARRCFPDSLLNCFPRLCSLDMQEESFHFQQEEDPMMLEHGCGLSPTVCGVQSTPGLPLYVPISQAW
jgi:hypothetical protein